MALLSRAVWPLWARSRPALPGTLVRGRNGPAHLWLCSASSRWSWLKGPLSSVGSERPCCRPWPRWGPGAHASPCRGCWRSDPGRPLCQLTGHVGRPGCRETSGPQEQPGSAAWVTDAAAEDDCV